MAVHILGIDPGSIQTGWGVVALEGRQPRHVASGTFKLGRDKPLTERLVVLHQELGRVLEQHRPVQAAVEEVYSGKNAQSALVLGHARGVALLDLALAGLEIHSYSPSLIKQTVTGQGRADKQQVARMVQLLLGLRQPLAPDQADALAVALTHAAMSRLRLQP